MNTKDISANATPIVSEIDIKRKENQSLIIYSIGRNSAKTSAISYYFAYKYHLC